MLTRPLAARPTSATTPTTGCFASGTVCTNARRLLMKLMFLRVSSLVSAVSEWPGAGLLLDVGNFSCTTDASCVMGRPWEAPYPQCVEGLCRCGGNTCVAVVKFSSLGTEDESYYCGECGGFGSLCNTSADCLPRDSDCNNGFCACRYGFSTQGVCKMTVNDSSASALNLGLVGILVLIILCNQCFTSRAVNRQIRRLTNRFLNRNRPEPAICQIDEDGTYHNPRGSSKSPSYALGNHDFYASSDDPDLDWAIALSLMETVRRRSASNISASGSQRSNSTVSITQVQNDSTTASSSQHQSASNSSSSSSQHQSASNSSSSSSQHQSASNTMASITQEQSADNSSDNGSQYQTVSKTIASTTQNQSASISVTPHSNNTTASNSPTALISLIMENHPYVEIA